MRHPNYILALFFSLLFFIPAFSQNEQTVNNESKDKQSVNLDELVVGAKRRTNRGDTLVVTPTNDQRRVTFNGYELLRSMQLPGLRINPGQYSIITSTGESVPVLINGRPATKEDILSLRPKNVAKVEYMQNPGPEYGYDLSIGAVVNFIMKERQDGYAIGLEVEHAVTSLAGGGYAYGKYDKRNSQFSAVLFSKYNSFSRRRIDNNDSYLLGDDWHTIEKKGMNTPIKYTNNTIQLGYNHFIPGKSIFDVTFSGLFYYSPERSHKQLVTEPGMSNYYQLTKPYEKNYAPELSLFYKHFFSNKSAIKANLVAVYRSTDYHYDMLQSYSEDMSSPFDTYGYKTDGSRQAYIAEVNYYNSFTRKIGLSAGVRTSYTNTFNKYDTDQLASTRMSDTNLYGFVGAYGYLGKLYYSLFCTLSGRMLDQNGIHESKWFVQPTFRFNYPVKNWRFALSGGMYQNAPSLSQMSDVTTVKDKFEATKGNPYLQNWWYYNMSFRISGNLGPVNIQNTFKYNIAHKPVMDYVDRINYNGSYLFINSFANQKGSSILSDDLYLYVPIAYGISVSGGVGIYNYDVKGENYTHNLTNWRFNASLDWSHGNWNAGFNWYSKEKSLSGETYTTSGTSNSVYLFYVLGQFRFGIRGENIFCKNGTTLIETLDSSVMKKTESIVVPATGNSISLSISWNFSKGKRRQQADVDLKNSDTETGIMKY